MSGKYYRVFLALTIMLLISAPYIMGFLADSSQDQFGGFLINPIDGNSYLAKMQQGFRGEWKFQLPYTAEAGEGAYLFLFYLFLGHIGRITHIPLIYVFHGARLLSAVWLLFVISAMLRELFNENKMYRLCFLLAGLGSGMGWIAALTGAFTTDFWVAEAYPFLSMYTNPHFSLGLGIMIYSLLPRNREKPFNSLVSGLLLGIIQPFAVVILGLVKVINGLVKIVEDGLGLKALIRKRWIWSILAFCLAGGLVITYQYWAILSDPYLSEWHRQNITVKPAPWDLVLSLSPCLIMGLVGIRRAWKKDTGKLLLIWGGVSLVLVFIPWSLQRRFLTGIFFPLAALSVYGLDVLSDKTRIKFRYWAIAVVFLAIPTNLIVITSGIQAITEKNPKVFLDEGLVGALNWIDVNGEQDALVLADEVDGLFVPAYTGRKVIYGHPFETINAEAEREWVESIFYTTHVDSYYEEILDARGVDLVIINKFQNHSFNNWLQTNWELAYQASETSVYARHKQ